MLDSKAAQGTKAQSQTDSSKAQGDKKKGSDFSFYKNKEADASKAEGLSVIEKKAELERRLEEAKASVKKEQMLSDSRQKQVPSQPW